MIGKFSVAGGLTAQLEPALVLFVYLKLEMDSHSQIQIQTMNAPKFGVFGIWVLAQLIVEMGPI